MVTLSAAAQAAAISAAEVAAEIAFTDAVVDLLDAGSTNPVAALEIGDTGFANVLLRFDLAGVTAFGDANALGVASATTLPATATAGVAGQNTAAEYRYLDKDDTVVWSGTDITDPTGVGEVRITDADTGTAGIQVEGGLVYNLTTATKGSNATASIT